MTSPDDDHGLRRRKNPTVQTTRDELLRKGYDLLMEQGFDHTINLRLTDVTRAEGRTSGAAYQIWPKQGLYHHDLALYLFRQDASASLAKIAKRLTDAETIEETVERAVTAYVRVQLDDALFQAYVRYWSAARRDQDLRQTMHQSFLKYQDALSAWYVSQLERFHLEPKDPYRMSDVTSAMGAIADGFVFRLGLIDDANRRIEFADGQRSLMTASILAVIKEMTRKKRRR